jgi:NitT/TauT family transport system permease protein
MNKQVKLFILRLVPLIVFVLLWEFSLRGNSRMVFYFGLPSKIWHYLIVKISNGSLIIDIVTTLTETIIGFLVGNILGTVAGLTLWFSKTVFEISKPYIIALGTAPIFALAPLMIIWFGTGMYSKIMMATLSTLFVALFQAYRGAVEVDGNYLKLMKTMNASKIQVFKKVIAPSSIVWVIAAFRLNVGFALLGAFIGEYISSNEGLGHLILVSSGLFDISLVLTGVLMLMVIAIGLNILVSKLEKPLKNLIVEYF